MLKLGRGPKGNTKTTDRQKKKKKKTRQYMEGNDLPNKAKIQQMKGTLLLLLGVFGNISYRGAYCNPHRYSITRAL